MRIILLLAGAAAIGTAAPARPAAPFAGHGAVSAPAGGPRAGTGWQGHNPTSMGRGRRPGRHGLRFYGGFGTAGATAAADPYGNGFFAGGGGGVRLRGGRPHYDYDRSYPYQWSPAAGAGPEPAAERRPAEPPRCTIENAVRVCRGW